MASGSRTFFYSVSHFLFILLLLIMLIHETESQQSCPKSFNLNCPDDVCNGEFPISHFTNSSLLYDQDCGGPCVLTCDSDRTRIKCNQSSLEPAFLVLDINPSDLTIAVETPDRWLPPNALNYDPCKAYSDIKSSFPIFKSVSLISRSGENETFLGCPNHESNDFWDDQHHTSCAPDYEPLIVYGPYEYSQFPSEPPPTTGCIQFGTYSPPKHNKNKGILAPTLEIALISIGIVAGLIVGLWCRLRRKNSSANLNVEAFLKSIGSSAPQRYNYSEIKRMTSFFKEKVGQGGFGAVYKGRLVDGRLVAVKFLKQSKGDDGEEFINEVATIGRTNHINIVTLLGFCFQYNKRALVYEFMPNGSLEKFTKNHSGGPESLTWQTMFEISLGIARGLEYLHRGCQTRILHFDIKPHNILLDKNFCPKISDFGLAKLYPQDKQSIVSMSEERGTIGYIAPEVFCRGFGEVSHKSDVYCYGMMVLEVIGSRRRANDGGETSSSDLYLPQWIYKQLDSGEEVDEVVRDEDKEVKRKLIFISLWCIQTVPSSRPSMSRVVQMLEAMLDTVEIPPVRTLSSPPRSNLYASASGFASEPYTVSL